MSLLSSHTTYLSTETEVHLLEFVKATLPQHDKQASHISTKLYEVKKKDRIKPKGYSNILAQDFQLRSRSIQLINPLPTE